MTLLLRRGQVAFARPERWASNRSGKAPALRDLLTLRGRRVLDVEHVLRIHPEDPAVHFDPLKRVATETLRYVIGVQVEPERERLLLVAAEHDDAGHGRESMRLPTHPGWENRLQIVDDPRH